MKITVRCGGCSMAGSRARACSGRRSSGRGFPVPCGTAAGTTKGCDGRNATAPAPITATCKFTTRICSSFIVAAALGSFLHGNGSSERLRSGRDAAGSLITPRKLLAVLEALKITERHWRRLTADWEDRYIAHRCGPGKVFLFTQPLLSECPACHAEIPVTKTPVASLESR